MKTYPFILASVFLTSVVTAQPTECTAPNKCLTADQVEQIKKALQELDNIHKAPVIVTVPKPIEIITDWNGITYINGGDKNPIPMKVKIGDTIDRDLAVTLPTQIYYRPKPPDPMFRLRIRAQAGVLLPQAFQADMGWNRFDLQLSFDFFHVGPVNLDIAPGARSVSIGPGLDLTKNFGVVTGYALVYDGFKSSAFGGIYFSF
jgi:hypothetical protein